LCLKGSRISRCPATAALLRGAKVSPLEGRSLEQGICNSLSLKKLPGREAMGGDKTNFLEAGGKKEHGTFLGIEKRAKLVRNSPGGGEGREDVKTVSSVPRRVGRSLQTEEEELGGP